MNTQHYSDLRAGNAARITTVQRTARGLVAAKLISFVGFILSGSLWITSAGTVWPVVTLLLLLLYIGVYRQGMKMDDTLEFYRAIDDCYRQELACLQRDFSEFDRGERFVDPSHEYSFDLDLFGPDSFFQRINRTVSALGAEQLAHYLTSLPDSLQEVNRRQEALEELARNERFCIHFRATGQGSSVDATRAMEALKSDRLPRLWGRPIIYSLMWLSVSVTLVLVVLAFLSVIPSGAAGMMFVGQLAVCICFAKRLYASTEKVAGLHKVFRQSWKLLKLIESEPMESSYNRELQSLLTREQPNAVVALNELAGLLGQLDSRNNALGMVLLDGLLLRDLFLIRRYNRWRATYLDFLPRWLDALAKLDALVSLATYQFNHPENCCPIIHPDPHAALTSQGMYHPFLVREKAVGNDFILRSTDLAIVTGANMAGKSTFLRTLGINYVMALCGLRVCADRFEVPLLRLFTGMRTTDNLSRNISYFHAELLRLEQLMEFCPLHGHTLVILDEILKGTNSEDKLKGSRMFLTQMSRMDLRAVVATHDLELSKLETENPRFQNYCFEIALGDEVDYSYKITRGVARNMNATFLLKKILNKK